MKNEDLKIDLIENSSPWITLTITHIPTGIHVSGKGKKRFRLKNDLLSKLRELIGEKDMGHLNV
jgi:hypothetical protein